MKKFLASKGTGDVEKNGKKINLTDLETQCILQLIQNKTPAKIAVDLGLSRNTVGFYLMNAGQKLSVIGKNRI